MAENSIFKIPDGMEYITIPVSAFGKNYDLPAVKDADDRLYRIPHKALSRLFRDLKSSGVNIKRETDVEEASPKYNLAYCRITVDGVQGEKFFGETNVTLGSSSAEKEAPFASAVNRAQDKAILDMLGFESQYFDENGTPVLYKADADITDEEETPAPENRKVIVEAKAPEAATPESPIKDITPAGDISPIKEDTPVEDEPAIDPAAQFSVQPAALTVQEEKEFQSLCNMTLKFTKKGEDVLYKLSAMSDNLLQWVVNNGNEAYANIAGRYLELKAKRGGI